MIYDITFALKNWERLVSNHDVYVMDSDQLWGYGENASRHVTKTGRFLFVLKHFKEVLTYSRDLQKLDRSISKMGQSTMTKLNKQLQPPTPQPTPSLYDPAKVTSLQEEIDAELAKEAKLQAETQQQTTTTP